MLRVWANQLLKEPYKRTLQKTTKIFIPVTSEMQVYWMDRQPVQAAPSLLPSLSLTLMGGGWGWGVPSDADGQLKICLN